MQIQLAINLDKSVSLQDRSEELAPKLKTEADVVAYHEAHYKRIERFETIGMCLMLLGAWAMWVTHGPVFGEAFGFVAKNLSSLLCTVGVASLPLMVIRRREGTVTATLEPHLCEDLEDLASRSPAVANYIREATAKGRTLRIFDAAIANNLAEDEAEARREALPGTACARLHAL